MINSNRPKVLLTFAAVAVITLAFTAGTARAQNIAPLGTAGNDGYNGVWGDPTNYINDGVWAWDSANGFHSDGGQPTRIWVEWTEDYLIDQVDLVHVEVGGGVYNAADYLIQALNSGGDPTIDGDWTTLVDVVGNTDTYPSYSFTPVTTDGIRLFVTDDGPNSPLRFEELLVFGELAPEITAVPEPHSIAIWSILGICLAGYGYRRRRTG